MSIVTRDWFGNQKTVTSSGWNLNTTMVRTTFSLDTSRSRCQQCRQLCWRLCPIYRNTACGRLLYHDGANRCRRDWWLQHRTNSTQTWTYRFQLPTKLHIRTTLDQHHNNGCNTDERKTMFTHIWSMTKSRQRQPSQQQEQRQSSTIAPISAKWTYLTELISSMLEASVSILHNVCGMANTQAIPAATASLIPPRNAGQNTVHHQLSNRGPSRKHRKQHNHLRICRSPNSNYDDSAKWKHHHQHSIITLTTTDDNSNGPSTATIDMGNTTSSWNTTVAYNGHGTVPCKDSTATWVMAPSQSVLSHRCVWKSKDCHISGWNLNTTMMLTNVQPEHNRSRHERVGNYVGDFVRFIATPPNGGSFTMMAQNRRTGLEVTAHQKTPHKPEL